MTNDGRKERAAICFQAYVGREEQNGNGWSGQTVEREGAEGVGFSFSTITNKRRQNLMLMSELEAVRLKLYLFASFKDSVKTHSFQVISLTHPLC